MKTAAPKSTSKPTDYPELRKQINDFDSTFYGPHSCQSCRETIVKMAIEQGGHTFTVPAENEIGGKYKPHVCEGERMRSLGDPTMGYSHFDSINYSVRHLAGKILTIVDASVADRDQRKATKDLVREAIKHTLDQISSGCYKLGVTGGCASTVEPLQQL